MTGEATSVGAIIGYLRMDDSDWRRTIDAAKGKADELSGKSPRIRIEVNSASAIAALSAVRAAEDRVDEGNKKIGASSKQASSGMGLLATSIIGLGPALIPLAGVGVAAFAGLAATGGVALLAIKGIQKELTSGTGVNKQYSGSLQTIKTDIGHLETVAAAGVLKSFNGAIAALHNQMPAVTRDVALMSSQLGQVVGHTAPALVSILHSLGPLFATFGATLVDGATKFQHWAASSDSIGKFVAYVENVLPTVERTLGALITTVAHLGMAFAPLGGTVLTTLGALSTLINAIPINVLATLAPVVATTVLAFKGFSMLSGASESLGNLASKLSGVENAVGGLSGIVGGASSALKALGVVGLAAGPIIGLLVAQLNKQKQAQIDAKQATDDYTQALVASNLAVDASVRSAAAKKLADTQASLDAAQLGISQGQVIDLITGQGTATDTLIPRLRALASQYGTVAGSNNNFSGKLTESQQAQLDNSAAAKDLLAILDPQAKAFDTASMAAKGQVAAINGVTQAAGESEAATKANAAAMGIQVGTYAAGVAAAAKNKAALDAQTEAMRFSNDAAGLLTQSLNVLNGVTLDVSAAQTTAASSVISLNAAVKANGNTTNLATAAGVANRQAAESAVRTNQQYAEAESKKTKSGVAATKMLTDQRTQFLANIDSTYGANSAIAIYTHSLYGVPKKVTSVADAQTKAANDKLDALKVKVYGATRARTVVITADTSAAMAALQSFISEANAAQAAAQPVGAISYGPAKKPPKKATGGTIRGPGSGTSDTAGLYALSDGEEVTPAAQAEKHRGLLKAIAADKVPGMATGGTVKKAPKVVNGSISATADGGAVYGIAGVIESQTGQAAQAMKYLSAAVNDAFKLDGVQDQIKVTQSQLANTKTALANLQTASNSLRSGVTSTLAGTVDPTKYTSIGDLISAYSTGTANNQHFAASEHAASAKGANKSLLAQLAAAGNSAGLDTLAGASKGDIALANKQFLEYQSSAGKGGVIASTDAFGSQIKADQARVAALTKQNAQQEARAAKLENVALATLAIVGKITNRPAKLVADGKEIGHVVIASNEFQGVLDNLTHQLLFGRH
jgi:hypothetical protein